MSTIHGAACGSNGLRRPSVGSQIVDVEVIERARKAGVSPMVTIADSLPEAKQCVEIATKYDDVFCTVGVHPHHAKDWKPGDGEVLKEMVAGSKKVKAIGEIGLDYHYMNSPKEMQLAAFESQLALAKELDLPAVVHLPEQVRELARLVKTGNATVYDIAHELRQWSL